MQESFLEDKFSGDTNQQNETNLIEKQEQYINLSEDSSFTSNNSHKSDDDSSESESEHAEVNPENSSEDAYISIDSEDSEDHQDHRDMTPAEEERRYPQRARKDKKYEDYLLYEAIYMLDEEPQTYEEAMSSIDKREWQTALNKEFECLQSNQTWELVKRPNQRVIPCKWVFKKKKNTAGETVKFKARLVAKGYSQVHGIDYQETFSPVVRGSTKTFNALAVEQNLSVDHLDVESAFLNGTLEETIYMNQPKGLRLEVKKIKFVSLKSQYMG